MQSAAAPPARTRIHVAFQGQSEERELDGADFIVGRQNAPAGSHLDLSRDIQVSRRHARIWADSTGYWIQDLGSRQGTKVDGVEIKERGPQRLMPRSEVRVGETQLRLVTEVKACDPPQPLDCGSPNEVSDVDISTSLDASSTHLRPEQAAEFYLRLTELPGEFANQPRLSGLLQLIVQRVMDLVPTSERGALLLCGRERQLLLGAYVSEGEPPVTETLARQALDEGKGFIWRRSLSDLPAASIKRLRIESGIYAPLLWQGQALGVLCVDNPRQDRAFSDNDLRLALAVAGYAALAVANQLLQDDLRRKQDDLRDNATVLERLLTNFSPKLRTNLVERARNGGLAPGGERSEVTILFADIRGFTALTAKMDASDVMSLLNAYLPALAQAVFAHEGTIDKFIGDGLLAVFGSPEADPQQQQHALRAALAMQRAMQGVSERRAARGEVVCQLGIGIHYGEVLHGFVGGADLLEFTVIGDTVNRASRFCDGARGGEVLLSPEAYQHLFRQVRAERTTIRTKNEGELTAFRVGEMLA